MADSPDTIALPETRQELEQLIEAAIARLDDIDDDPDLEPSLGSNVGRMNDSTYWPPEWAAARTAHIPDECEDVSEDEGAECEDEGAQCDDEGTVEEDRCEADDVLPTVQHLGREVERARQVALVNTSRAVIEKLRTVQQRHGEELVRPLRVLGGQIVKS